MEKQKDVFNVLNAVNVNDRTEKKNGLTYLSWAWAWGEVKKRFPDAFYTIYENERGWLYHTDGRTCWVKTGVTIEGQELIEYLPVMDFKNRSIPADQVTSYDVNKAVQRSLTKAIARHGLGLYIYAGEDLPEDEAAETKEPEKKPAGKKTAAKRPDDNKEIGEDNAIALAKQFQESGIDPAFVIKLYGVESLAKMTWVQVENARSNIDKILERQEANKK